MLTIARHKVELAKWAALSWNALVLLEYELVHPMLDAAKCGVQSVEDRVTDGL